MTARLVDGLFLVPVLLSASIVFAASPGENPVLAPFEIKALSSRPEFVSSNDALLELKAAGLTGWSIQLNGRDVTSSFRPVEGSRRVLGRVTDLVPGRNVLMARGVRGAQSKLVLIAHSRNGPLLSGPHQQPFVCQTVQSGLGPSSDTDCNAPMQVQYYYKSSDPATPAAKPEALSGIALASGFKPYDPAAPLPADVADIVLPGGRPAKFIVRRELGTLNRGVYDIQFLNQPPEQPPTPWTGSGPGWNGRLLILADGGCGSGYRQGTFNAAIGAANEVFLRAGYATAASTLASAANNCNDRVFAETVSMLKEHFIKKYGEPVHTIGWGNSGGAAQLYLTAQNYPGLLDGIIPFVAFPDLVTTAQSVTDCRLLARAFRQSGIIWSDEQKAAVSGFASWQTCEQNYTVWPIADAATFCDPSIPTALIFDADSRPEGARCDLYSNAVNVLGRDPASGFARRPLDNVGVQYGLTALRSGQIDAEHFIALNERIGGYDDDGHLMAARTVADTETIEKAYRNGAVLTGGGGLNSTPIIEWRPYSDDMADNHDAVRGLMTRARLIAANGNAANQVLLIYPRYSRADLARLEKTHRFESIFPEHALELAKMMDRWLDSMAADTGTGTDAARIARNKPPGLADGCRATDGEVVVEQPPWDTTSRCGRLYPTHADPRVAAGGPQSDDVLKCTLKPIDPTDYPGRLSTQQLQRLRVVFPQGVCNNAKPGVGQGVRLSTWQTF